MPDIQIFEIRYIGRCKERRGTSSALGMVNSDWQVILPEKVLRKWFGVEDPTIEENLYSIIGAKQPNTEQEIKTAYRRMAMQWHPDKCKEPNAHEVFLRIQEAYNILSDENKRARYDAGLKLQANAKVERRPTKDDVFGYRAPLRCGALMVTGYQSGRWYVVDEILAWEDIVRDGKTLVTSWIYGDKEPVEQWV